MISDEEIQENSMLGKRVGAYELKREIGRGGMGAVYLAERVDGEFRQTVAIKLIKRGMDTDLILKRFRRERQIIAALDHPNITYFLAGGSTEDGLPYFVMEYIDGKSLYKFCDENRLSIEERLKIFRQICDAVETAHKNKVIHRDLKPSNILVKKDGTPKLLDFGIAKVLDPDLAVTDIDPTATAMRVMTPEYASPEQVTGSEITPISDVYSLGIILYEILTGHRPYKLKRRVPHEVARIICEEEPSRPSHPNTDAEMQIATLEYISQSGNLAREIEDSKFRLQNLRFDELDRIVLKSLRKNPKERYGSAAALAADITNFLEKRPVNAEVFLPESVVRKNASDKKSVAILPFKLFGAETAETTEDIFLGVGLTDALISRLSGVKRLIFRPTSTVLRFSERDDSFAVGHELSVDFVVDGTIRRVGERLRVTAQLLSVEDNSTVWSESFDEKSTDVLELEDSLSEKIAKSLLPKLTGEEEKQLNKRGTNNADAYDAYLRGRVNWNFQTEQGFARAINFYQRAVELDPEYAQAYAAIAEYYTFLGIHCVIPFLEGSAAAKQAAEQAVRLDPTLAEGHAALGFSALAFDLDWQKAFDRISRAIEINPNSLQSHFWRAAMLVQTKKFELALDELKILNELDPDSLLNLHMQAWVFYHARRYDESIGNYRQILKIEPTYAWGILSYSWALRRAGEFEEAIEQAERAVQLTGETPFYLTNLAATYADAGNRKRAEEVLAQILEIGKTRFVSEYMLALIYCALGDKDKAFENLETSLKTHDSWINWLGVEPQFDILRDDPRFDDLLHRAGNPLAKSEKPDAAKAKEKRSIAVLPLKITGAENLQNADEEDSFLGIGLADALITRLSNMKRLIVRPTSSVLQLAGLNPLDAGRNADVDFILSGAIRKSGERIRVTVQLLNINQSTTVWAENFDEKYTDVLELEDSISDKVTRSLLPKLTGEEKRRLEKRGTNSHEAYEAYLRGRAYWNMQTPDGFARAVKSYERAVQLDPRYAQAWVAIAEYYIFLGIHCVIPFGESASATREAAEKAVKFDPLLADAQATLGFVAGATRYGWREAEELFEKALELNPNSLMANFWYSALLAQTGRFEESLEIIRKMIESDPSSLLAVHMRAWVLYYAREFTESVDLYRKMLNAEPNYPWGVQSFSWALRKVGRFHEAIEQAEYAVQLTGETPLYMTTLAAAYADAGERDKTFEILDKLHEIGKTQYVSPFMLSYVYCALGDKEKAFELLEKTFEMRDDWMRWFGVDPQFDNLRGDPRYNELLHRTGNPLAKKFKSDQAVHKASADISDGEKSIAILPLKMTGAGNSKNTDEVFLGIGLADALVSRLSGVQRLIVRPTSSVLPFADKNPIEAGKNIGVDYVLDGTIRRAGERIRISVQLLNVAEGSTIWAEKLDENYTDVLELEDVISEKVARILLPQLTGEERRRLEKRGTNNLEAYQAYLRGRYFANQFTDESLLKSVEEYKRAVELDPGYVMPYVGIADFYVWSAVFGEMPCRDAYPAAKKSIENALRADQFSAEAYALQAFITLLYDKNWAEAERLIKRALELNPNFYFAHECLSNIFTTQGIFAEAEKEILRAEELDPLSPRAKLMSSWTFYQSRNYADSIFKSEQANEMQPDFPQGLIHLGNTLEQTGDTARAISCLRRCLELWDTAMTRFMLCYAFVAEGRREEAENVLAELLQIAEIKHVKPYFIAMAYVALDDFDNAFSWFEKSLEAKDEWLIWFGIEPKLDKFRKDERYFEILKRTNNPIHAKQKQSSSDETTDGSKVQKSIAVLPFKVIASGNTGASEEAEYLSIGLADSLTMRLSNVRRFLVRPTSSVLTFGSPETEPFFAGRELGVDYVVDGNIRRVGDRIRVAVQLLNVGENSTHWAERFDEKLTDVLALEDSISERVTKSLLPKLTGEEQRSLNKRGTNSPEAFDAYMQARFYWNQFTPETFPKVLEALEKAVAIDPNYAPAYAGIADFYNWAAIYGFFPNTFAAPKVYAAANRALEIDDTVSEAYAALGLYYSSLLNYEKSQENYRRSIALTPNYSLVHEWYGSNLTGMGFFEEGVRECELAEQLDPFSLRAKTLTAWTKYQAGKFDSAYRKGKEMLALDPNYPQCYLQIGNAALELGLVEEALETTEKAAELMKPSPVAVYPYCFALVRTGQTEKAREVVREFVEQSKTAFVTPYFLAMAHVAIGETDEAFKYFEKSFEDSDHWLLWFGTEPKLEAIRTDERYFELFEKTNNPLFDKQKAEFLSSRLK